MHTDDDRIKFTTNIVSDEIPISNILGTLLYRVYFARIEQNVRYTCAAIQTRAYYCYLDFQTVYPWVLYSIACEWAPAIIPTYPQWMSEKRGVRTLLGWSSRKSFCYTLLEIQSNTNLHTNESHFITIIIVYIFIIVIIMIIYYLFTYSVLLLCIFGFLDT